MDNTKLIAGIGIMVVLAVIGASYQGTPSEISKQDSGEPQNKSVLIYNAVKKNGIAVEDAYTTNGTEIKEAFGLENSIIAPDETIAFVIFTYSARDGPEKKVEKVLSTIYTTLQVDASIDGVLVLPYDPEEWALGAGPNMVYANRSHAQGLALKGLTPPQLYNNFDMYTISTDIR